MRKRQIQRETENMQCAIASACKHYRYCDQTYAAKHFSSGNALSIYYKAAKHFSSGNALSIYYKAANHFII